MLIKEKQNNSYYWAALYYRPFCQKKMGNEDEANKNFNEAIALYRLATLEEPSLIEAYMYRVMCLKDMEKYDDALEILEFLENLNDKIAEIYTLRADIYTLSDQKSLAKEELEKAYAIKPELRAAFEQEEGGDE